MSHAKNGDDFQPPRLLGNAVISKKFLRTRKIMVIHSNEMGEYCLCTLIGRKRKRYDNAVDVVVRLDDRPILVQKVRHLRDLHTFGSVTSHELTIQQSVEEELRYYDGMMVVMMMLPEQGEASPKHRYDMTEVDYGGGGTAHG